MVPVAVKMMNIVTINKKDKTEVTMAKSASAMMPREKKQVLNSSSSSLEVLNTCQGMRVSKNLTGKLEYNGFIFSQNFKGII